MKTQAVVLNAPHSPFEMEELDVDGPQANEVLVQYEYAGLCHSDLHFSLGHMGFTPPMVFGHEGSGKVLEVGPGVTRVKPGDHFVASFIPACGKCRWCATGNQRLCDTGANGIDGYLPGKRYPFTGKQGNYAQMMALGTFSQYATIHENSVVKIDDDLSLEVAALVGCGVPTGWGAAVNTAAVRAGDVVVIYGVGGLGTNAVQGARYAGAKHIVAVDPVEFKRDNAKRFGATHTAATAEEAHDLVQELTRGVGADKALIIIGVLDEATFDAAWNVVSKAGNVVPVSMGYDSEKQVHINGVMHSLYSKTVTGCLYGGCNPTYDIPRLLGLYRNGDLMLDELITKTYSLDQVNEGYADLQAGKNIRGVVKIDH